MKTQNAIKLNTVEWGALALTIVGALNWGLVGLGEFVGTNLNLVNFVLGSVPTIENVVYLLVGLAGLYMVYVGYQLLGARSGDTEREDPERAERRAAPK